MIIFLSFCFIDNYMMIIMVHSYSFLFFATLNLNLLSHLSAVHMCVILTHERTIKRKFRENTVPNEKISALCVGIENNIYTFIIFYLMRLWFD